MKKCIIWVRCSTEKQELESQKKETIEYARELKFDEFIVIGEVGASAYKVNKLYQEMVDRMKHLIEIDKFIEAVVCWHLNRLARNDKVAMDIKDFLINNKVNLYVREPHVKLLKDNGDVDEGAELVFSVFSTMAKQQAAELRSKVKRARVRDRALKKYTGGKPPSFGYMVEEKFLVPHPQNADIVREMYELYATGEYSYNQVIKEVNERYGILFTNWHIREILTKTLYYDNTIYPAIITKELYDKVEQQRNNSASKPSQYKHHTFANRIIKCPICGTGYTTSMGRYVCPAGKYGCHAPNISISNLDGLLWLITSHLESERLLHTDSKKELLQNKAVLDAKIKSMGNYTTKGEKARQRAKEMALRGFIDLDTLEARLKEIDDEEKEVRQKIEKWQSEVREIERLVEEDSMSIKRILALADQISGYDEEQMRTIVRRWIKTITIEGKVITIETLVRVYRVRYDRYGYESRWYTMNNKPIAVRPIDRVDDVCRFGKNRCGAKDIVTTLAFLNGSLVV